jgi:protein-S-isoprenylcysteine O-methyltransferase Ste14
MLEVLRANAQEGRRVLLNDWMRESGGSLFRWRSFVLLIFVPLLALAVRRGEPVERFLGGSWGELYEFGCIVLVLAGLALRAFTVGSVPCRTSGRNTHGQVASSLNVTGMYSLTRNPLYLANSIAYLGVLLYSQDLLLTFAFALFLVVYYERIILAEEAFLLERFGDAYRRWASEVPAFVPRLHGWRRPALPFSVRSVLRREHPTWLAALLSLAAIDLVADYFGGDYSSDWNVTLVVGLAGYLVLHVLNRRTRVLRVPGR